MALLSSSAWALVEVVLGFVEVVVLGFVEVVVLGVVEAVVFGVVEAVSLSLHSSRRV